MILFTLCSLYELQQRYCVLRLLCIALVISSMNQTETLTSLEPWNSWNLQPCKPGNLQLWNLGTLQHLGTLDFDAFQQLRSWVTSNLGCTWLRPGMTRCTVASSTTWRLGRRTSWLWTATRSSASKPAVRDPRPCLGRTAKACKTHICVCIYI